MTWALDIGRLTIVRVRSTRELDGRSSEAQQLFGQGSLYELRTILQNGSSW